MQEQTTREYHVTQGTHHNSIGTMQGLMCLQQRHVSGIMYNYVGLGGEEGKLGIREAEAYMGEMAAVCGNLVTLCFYMLRPSLCVGSDCYAMHICHSWFLDES